MYSGTQIRTGKNDTIFEFETFINTVNLIGNERWLECREILYQLFLAAARVVLDYRWLPECKGADTTGLLIGRELIPDANGNRESDILGNWNLNIHYGNGFTKLGAIQFIEKDMERFLAKRFAVEEHKDLQVIRQEYERNKYLQLFTGLAKEDKDVI